MKIYTKRGDQGKTDIPSQGRVGKDHPYCDAVGTLDELNAYIGKISTFIEGDLQEQLFIIQQNLLFIGAEIAVNKEESKLDFDDMASRLEAIIDVMESGLPPLKNFILPGGTLQSSEIHIARAVCRRCERTLVEVNYPVKYINRLSDFLFTLARVICSETGGTEQIWSGKLA